MFSPPPAPKPSPSVEDVLVGVLPSTTSNILTADELLNRCILMYLATVRILSHFFQSLDSTDSNFLDVSTYVQHGTVQTQYICIRATQLYLAGRASLISSRTLSLLILPPNQSFQIQE